MKRANEKKAKRREMYDKATMIKCRYCNDKADCKHRANKEKSEKMGFTTYCTLTSNKPRNGKYRKIQ